MGIVIVIIVIVTIIVVAKYAMDKAEEERREREKIEKQKKAAAEKERLKKKYEVLTSAEKDFLKRLDEKTRSDLSAEELEKMPTSLQIVTNAFQKAVKGDTKEMVELGLYYYGILHVPEKAFYWYNKASEQGNPRGMYFLGLSYLGGDGVKPDKMKGTHWMLQAAMKGNKEAIDCLKKDFGMSISEMKKMGIPV